MSPDHLSGMEIEMDKEKSEYLQTSWLLCPRSKGSRSVPEAKYVLQNFDSFEFRFISCSAMKFVFTGLSEQAEKGVV
jgi:hypothetical protein